MTRWVAADTLDRAARVIEARPGLSPVDLADALGMSPASMNHVVSDLRRTGEVLPNDVITVAPDLAPTVRAPEATQARILRRCRKGIVVVSELAAELDEDAEEITIAVRRMRWNGLVVTPTGIWPATSHHDPVARAALFRDDEEREAAVAAGPKLDRSERPPKPKRAKRRGRRRGSCWACGRTLRVARPSKQERRQAKQAARRAPPLPFPGEAVKPATPRPKPAEVVALHPPGTCCTVCARPFRQPKPVVRAEAVAVVAVGVLDLPFPAAL